MASALIGALRVSLGLDSSRFEDGIKSSQNRLSSTQKSFEAIGGKLQGVGVAMTAAISLPFAALVKTSMGAATESAQALAQVEAAQKSMRGASKLTTEQLKEMAGALQDTSNFDDDDILVGLTSNLLTFGNIAGDQFKRAQQAAVDMSARMGTSLQGAAIMIGKALNDPAKGISKLTKVGITFTDQQKAQVKAMVAAGDAAGAQGIMLAELERQFGGAAAAQRAATPGADAAQQWRTFQEVVGEFANKVLPPLTKFLAQVLKGFNELSPATQQLLVGTAAVAAALGPLSFGLGTIMKLVVPIIPAFMGMLGAGTAAGAGATAAGAGAGVAATGFAALLAPVAAVAAAVGALYLVWKNWDTIGPVLEGVGSAFMEAVGPSVLEAVDSIKASLQQLWDGPLGEGIRAAMPYLVSFGKFMLEVFGTAIITQVKFFAAVISGAFKLISDIITVFARLLTGDFSGAWEAAKAMVVNAVGSIGRIIEALVPGALAAIGRLVTGIKEWIMNRLQAIWDFAGKQIKKVGQFFYNLWDAVVGHSYIPDMVEGIGAWMAKLETVMVQPASKATEKTRAAFERLKSILDRLFPEEVAARRYAEDLAFVEANAAKLGLTAVQTAEALQRMRDSYADETFGPRAGAADVELDVDASDLLPGAETAMDELVAMLERTAPEVERAIGGPMRATFEGLGQTINDTIGNGLKGLMRGFGDLEDIALEVLYAIGDAIINELMKNLAGALGGGAGAGAGGGIGGIISTALSSFINSGGFAKGGRPPAGKFSLVGEEGPELWKPDTRGRIIPNDALGGRGGGVVRLIVEGSPYFDARVEEVSGGVMLDQAPTMINAASRATIAILNRKRLR